MGAQNFFSLSLILQFCFFHALGVLGYGEGIDHRLDVTSEEALQVVGGIADAMVGHTSLREVVGADLGTAVARRNQGLAAAGDVIDILLVFLVVDVGTKARSSGIPSEAPVLVDRT